MHDPEPERPPSGCSTNRKTEAPGFVQLRKGKTAAFSPATIHHSPTTSIISYTPPFIFWTQQPRRKKMRILRLKDVIEKTGLARSTIYKYVGAGTFPEPVPLGGRTVGWLDSEVHEWIAEKVRSRNIHHHPMNRSAPY